MENALDVSEESGEHIDEEEFSKKAEVAEGSGHKARGIKSYSHPKTMKMKAWTTCTHSCVLSVQGRYNRSGKWKQNDVYFKTFKQAHT